jgi:hypothetical protein
MIRSETLGGADIADGNPSVVRCKTGARPASFNAAVNNAVLCW